jgi:hypothetical protein
MARKHSPRIPKERFRPAPQQNQIVDDRTGNLNLFLILFPKSLDARGMIGVKECILKPRTFVL